MLFGLIRPDAGTIRVHGKTWDADGIGVLDGVGLAAEEQMWEKFRKSESAPVVELRSPRRVNG